MSPGFLRGSLSIPEFLISLRESNAEEWFEVGNDHESISKSKLLALLIRPDQGGYWNAMVNK